MARPRAVDYDDKRKAILSAAAHAFAETGFDGASMSQIALACGVSKALLYHYYTNKEQLLFDVIEAHLEDLVAAVEAVPADLGPTERLVLLCTAILEAYRDADAEHKVQINNLSRLPADKQDRLKEMERRLVDVFAEAIAHANPDLRRDPRLLKPVTMSLFGMLNWHYLWFRPGGPISRQDYAALVARMIVTGTNSLDEVLSERG
ncbi:TetR/AcrR family transcriptional regulator [Amorphus orientalis]|uniref:TetR/AcrR family transcriptional regulator n=1 Tax=Amorphus orientalis TaxID=649198 RepID=A0AAE3VQI3_9HYPH|nr:TetR/AcrR family transcriptional regulator [Amorphus orientalis]MDQ0316098.1 TetR/AcrR family transcriptional regulator [Amorphus orientalis]